MKQLKRIIALAVSCILLFVTLMPNSLGVLAAASQTGVYNDNLLTEGLDFSSDVTYQTAEELFSEIYTMSSWIYLPESLPDSTRGGVIVGNYKDGGYPCYSFEIKESGNPRFYHINTKTGNTPVDITFTDVDVRGEGWVHLAFTLNDSTNEVSCYVNGVKKATQTAAALVMGEVAAPCALGGDLRVGNARYFQGRILEVALYGTALGEDQISDLYSKGVDVEATDLFAYYDLSDYTKGDIILDTTDNGNDMNVPVESKELTFSDWGMPEQPIAGALWSSKTPITSWENVVISGEIAFSSLSADSYLGIGVDSENQGWSGLRIRHFGNGTVILVNSDDTSYAELGSAGFKPLVDNVKAGEAMPFRMAFAKTSTGDLEIAISLKSDGAIVTVPAAKAQSLKLGLMVSGTSANTVTLTSTAKEETDGIREGFGFSSDVTYQTAEKLSSVVHTLSSWIYLPESLSDSTRGGVILGNYEVSQNSCYSFEIKESGNPRFYHQNTVTAEVVDLTFTDIDVRGEEWVHLAFTLDETSNEVTCYLNGVKKSTQVVADLVLDEVTAPCALGGDLREGNARYFQGRILEIALYNEVFAAEEITGLYENGVDLEQESLFAYYDLETANQDDDIADLSGNGNDLILDARYFANKEPVTDYAYSFAVVGDTQIVTWNDVMKGQNNLSKIYDWILANKEEKNIQHVFGLGDITDKNATSEWEHAKTEISKLDGNVTYSLIRGNHDVYYTDGDYFTQYMGTEQYRGQFANGGFYEKDNINNVWCTFRVGEIDYLILGLDFGASDDVLEWAGEIISSHPYHNVIITTHSYLYRDGTTLDAGDLYPPTYYNSNFNNGDDMWDELISKHENIVLVMSGHDPCENIVMTQTKGDNGNIVTQMLIDAQDVDRDEGSTGMVAMLYFSKDGRKVQVECYSTVHEKFFLKENQFSFDIAVMPAEPAPSVTAAGVSIRVPDDNTKGGIRFKMKVDTPFEEGIEVIEQGTLIVPKYVLGENELNLQTSKVLNVVKTENRYYSYTDDYYEYTAVLTDIPDEHLKTDICARGYITYRFENGEVKTVYSDVVTQNIYSVAEKIVESSTESEELKLAVKEFVLDKIGTDS